MLSARNQFVGTVKAVRLGGIMAEVIVQVGELEIVSAAVIKSTEVLIDK
jgi:molybdopterin-binding protein